MQAEWRAGMCSCIARHTHRPSHVKHEASAVAVMGQYSILAPNLFQLQLPSATLGGHPVSGHA